MFLIPEGTTGRGAELEWEESSIGHGFRSFHEIQEALWE